jgi:hypothetical protein
MRERFLFMGCITGKYLKFGEENRAYNLAFRLNVGRGGHNGQDGLNDEKYLDLGNYSDYNGFGGIVLYPPKEADIIRLCSQFS